MQNGYGTPFHDMSLNQALKEHIINDNSLGNSTRVLLQKALEDNIDWQNNIFPSIEKPKLH